MGIASVIHQLAILNVVASTILASKLSKSSDNNAGKNKTTRIITGPRISPAFRACFLVKFIRHAQTDQTQ
jgi:hypothetical protein